MSLSVHFLVIGDCTCYSVPLSNLLYIQYVQDNVASSRRSLKYAQSLAKNLLVPGDIVHGGRPTPPLDPLLDVPSFPGLIKNWDLDPIPCCDCENTILPSYTQSERIKLRLPPRDHGDPITPINRSDNLIKCVFSPLRRKSVAYGECRVRAFREMSSFCQDTLATLFHCAILYLLIDGHVERKEYLSVWNKFWYFCDVRVVYTHNCSSNIISASKP